MSNAEPPPKRMHTDQLDSSIDTDPSSGDADGYVHYADYLLLHSHVASLTEVITSLRDALLSSSAKTVVEKVALCPQIPQLPKPIHPALKSGATASYASITALPASTASTASTAMSPTDHSEATNRLIDKSTKAVVERLFDDKEDKYQDAENLAFFQNVARNHNLPLPIRCHRHECKSDKRPLKLQFSSKIDRDSYLHGFNRAKNSDSSILGKHPMARIRRDLTNEELLKLRESRKKCYDENLKAGKSLFIVKDINVVANPKPKDFRPKLPVQ